MKRLALAVLAACDPVGMEPTWQQVFHCACDFDGDGIGEVKAPMVGPGTCQLQTASPTEPGVCV